MHSSSPNALGRILSTEQRTYIADAIARIQAGAATSESGSHIAGIFGIAAQYYEDAMRQRVLQALRDGGVDYYNQIQPRVKGQPHPDKLTLGQILYIMRLLPHLPGFRVGQLVPPSTDLGQLTSKIDGINQKWVGVKHHGETITAIEAVKSLKAMLESADLLAG